MSPSDAHLADSEGFMPHERVGLSDFDCERRARAAAKQQFLNRIRNFQTKHAEARKSHAVIVALLRQGYRYATPNSSTWSQALYREVDGSLLFVLFRKRGIDLRIFSSSLGVAIDEANTVSFSGGVLLRMNYANVRIAFSIHRFVRELHRHDMDTVRRMASKGIYLLASDRVKPIARSDIKY